MITSKARCLEYEGMDTSLQVIMVPTEHRTGPKATTLDPRRFGEERGGEERERGVGCDTWSASTGPGRYVCKRMGRRMVGGMPVVKKRSHELESSLQSSAAV